MSTARPPVVKRHLPFIEILETSTTSAPAQSSSSSASSVGARPMFFRVIRKNLESVTNPRSFTPDLRTIDDSEDEEEIKNLTENNQSLKRTRFRFIQPQLSPIANGSFLPLLDLSTPSEEELGLERRSIEPEDKNKPSP